MEGCKAGLKSRSPFRTPLFHGGKPVSDNPSDFEPRNSAREFGGQKKLLANLSESQTPDNAEVQNAMP